MVIPIIAILCSSFCCFYLSFILLSGVPQGFVSLLLLLIIFINGLSYPCKRPSQHIELSDVEDPTLYKKIGSQMAVRLLALRTGQALRTEYIVFLLLILISVTN
jgi:hypothetical protein